MLITDPSPGVSIILPTFNRAAYIFETIEGIRNQTYPNWELIIMDDGSDDNTEELVAEIKDRRIQFHKAGRIGIGGKIKNLGLEKVSGELIAFIDSDDLWAPTKLEKQVKALQDYPGAGFSLAGGYNFRKPGEPLDYFYKQREGAKYGNLFISFFKSEAAAFTQALLFRKDCIASIGTFKEVRSFSDADFIISLALHFDAVIIYEPLVFRRIHDENYIHSNWEKSYQEGIEMIESYKNLLPAAVAANAFFRLYINSGEEYLRWGRIKSAISHFLRAWKERPFSYIPIKKILKGILHKFLKRSYYHQ